MFKQGDIVVRGKVDRILPNRTDYSFQIDLNTHVDLDEPARLLNHSCDPNLGLRSNEFGGYDFVALREIAEYEELCWDYCMSEYISIAVSGNCLCGSNICRREITGFKYLPQETKNKYGKFIADYLKGSKKILLYL